MNLKNWFFTLLYFTTSICFGQHIHKIKAVYDEKSHTIKIDQTTQFISNIPLDSIVLNDWNNAYSNKKSPLGYRFSDEFVRSFHLAKDSDLGRTSLNYIKINDVDITSSIKRNFDLISFKNNFGTNFIINLQYTLTLPDSKFSGYGYDKKGNVILKDWLIIPSKIENGKMIYFHNENLFDAALDLSSFDIDFVIESKNPTFLISNLNTTNLNEKDFKLTGNGVKNVEVQLTNDEQFETIKTKTRNIQTNLQDKKLQDFQKEISIHKIVEFVDTNLLIQNNNPILISQYDYQKSPFYGLNQLPSFISPFDNQLIYELKFLKTYLSKITYESFSHNPRNETWITDGYQTYLIMEYIKTYYPNLKMMGYLSNFKLLSYYNLFQRDFNDQFEIVYLLMARKNLDQPVGNSKDTFIKFNEQISGRYKSGLNFKYIADYLGKDFFNSAIQNYSLASQKFTTNQSDFFKLFTQNAPKPMDWFPELIHSNTWIDYKIKDAKKDKENVYLKIKNKTGALAPISFYQIKKDTLSQKTWLPAFKKDTILKLPKNNEKYVLNYFGEVPEIYRNNNWYNSNFGLNRPLKLTFFRDIEDPNANQLYFLPEFSYNYYDGISPAISLNNKSVFVKPLTFDIAPTLSWNTKTLIGNASFTYNQIIRNKSLYNIRYNIFGHTYHYAPNARYYKISPSVIFNFRDLNLRKNSGQNIIARYVILDREKSSYLNPQDENYSVFNLKYNNSEHEFTRLYKYGLDLQTANKFGKISADIHYRKLFSDNRHFTVRGYAGLFMYKKTQSTFFDFGVDRPTDYLYDYGLLGRSESTGILSQQFILAEGGFKSMFKNRYADQWLLTSNFSYTIWNWIEGYSDLGFMKNHNQNAQFIYDTGIRLNLVQDYFELYFPLYSNNGWEVTQDNYPQKIRFVFTLSPKTLLSLFTRKWF